MEIVQDTNVFVAALRSQEGASAEVLDRCLAQEDQAVMGDALFAEYEQLVQRESLWRGVPVTAAEREMLLDDFCAAAIWQPIYFRWRPNLPDADDDHVLELAIAGGVEHLVTHNTRRGKFQFAPLKVARVVGNQMFHATGYRQFQNVVVIRIRQVWPPAEINRLPNRRRAEIVQYRFPFRRCPRHAPP